MSNANPIDEKDHTVDSSTKNTIDPQRSLALLFVCWEFYHEYQFYFPSKFLAKTSGHFLLPNPKEPLCSSWVRLYFNKYDVLHLSNIGTFSRMPGFTEVLKSNEWTKSIEVLHLPWSCFMKYDGYTIKTLSEGLLAVFKAFSSLREVRTASGLILSSWHLDHGQWTPDGSYEVRCMSGNYGFDSDSEENEYENRFSGSEDEQEVQEGDGA
ncbi:hypothetical protein ONS95_005220 [Cadophora gregata]|uniref:uncharacterized protein n=1 Tax=Cadophora gregata TaxID=51156 RepID=UPI0026DCB365|nr:uncharacterized protein ONS95_005220 [Cadophora gregata]KAK0104959.1 hypothetical protein ONS95_005220 [Cadophora gregata]